MGSEWMRKPLGEILTFANGKSTPDRTESGKFVVYGSNGPIGRADLSNAPGDTIIVGRVGSYCGSTYLSRKDCWVTDNAIRASSKGENDIFFAFYLLNSLNLNDRRAGSGQPLLNQSILNSIEVAVPPPTEQRMIGDVLSILDDRIDLLRQTNATLEAIAQALFKSWFVDFDPVHAKADDREPEAMDVAATSLFPSEFEESELGPIPKGWASSAVYDLAQFINGAAYKAFDPNRENRGLPIIKIAELKAGVTEQTAYSDVKMPDKYRIDTGDILFSWSGNPDTSIDTFVWTSGSAWLNQHIFRVVPSSTGERSFVLLALKYLKPTFAEIARNKQTTGLGHVTVSDLKRLQITKPDEAVLQRWSLLVDPLVERAFAVQQQAQTLVELRDTLLPRLISGKLRLPEAAEAAEAALACRYPGHG